MLDQQWLKQMVLIAFLFIHGCFYLLILVEQGLELKALCLIGRHSTT
jgi:hypothetical protein